MSDKRPCPRCGGEAEVGWLTDNAGQSSWQFVRWAQGAPETGLMGMIKAPRDPLPVLSYCCVDCGHLELYVPRSKPQP